MLCISERNDHIVHIVFIGGHKESSIPALFVFEHSEFVVIALCANEHNNHILHVVCAGGQLVGGLSPVNHKGLHQG